MDWCTFSIARLEKKKGLSYFIGTQVGHSDHLQELHKEDSEYQRQDMQCYH